MIRRLPITVCELAIIGAPLGGASYLAYPVLLGAGWFVLKSEGTVRDWAYHRVGPLAAGVLVVLGLAFAVTFDYSVLARSDLQTRNWGLAFPAIGALAPWRLRSACIESATTECRSR